MGPRKRVGKLWGRRLKHLQMYRRGLQGNPAKTNESDKLKLLGT